MAKPNTYVQLMNARKEIAMLRGDLEYMKGFTLQQSLDMAMIALNLEFNFGPKYNERFEKKFLQVFLEYASMCVEDGKDDEEIIYTKEKVDKALTIARGEILPFDERYESSNLYFRSQLQKMKEEMGDA